jgi:hypothetical protein
MSAAEYIVSVSIMQMMLPWSHFFHCLMHLCEIVPGSHLVNTIVTEFSGCGLTIRPSVAWLPSAERYSHTISGNPLRILSFNV